MNIVCLGKDKNGMFSLRTCQTCKLNLKTRNYCLHECDEDRVIVNGIRVCGVAFCTTCALFWRTNNKTRYGYFLGMLDEDSYIEK